MKCARITAPRAVLAFAVLGLALAASSIRLADKPSPFFIALPGSQQTAPGQERRRSWMHLANLFGTTTFGGNVNLTYCDQAGYTGCGAVFKLDNERSGDSLA